MRNILNELIVLLVILFVLPNLGIAQGNLATDLSYEVNRVYKPLSISKKTLQNAETVADLNKHYKPSWVKKYISVEVLTRSQGKVKRAMGKSNILSQKQKEIMNTADVGTDISIVIRYIPNNKLKHNDIKEFDFAFMVNPDHNANYLGGEKALREYIKENAIDAIPSGSFNELDLAAVKFTIDEEGKAVNVHLFETTQNEQIDELLLKTIRTMPNWQTAAYADGTKTKQEFVLTIGNMESCVMNLLNIRQD